MTSKTTDDFWNSSSSSGFNFDDDEDFLQQSCGFTTVPEENSFISINSLISKDSLDLILNDIVSTNEYVAPPVEEAIRKMISGQRYSLELYKKLSDKLLLLDAASDSMDGNIILNVILFLKSTLRQNIFFHQLAKRKLAGNHYANHLIVNKLYHELADFYMATGLIYNMKQVYYLIGRDINNKDTLLKRLETFRKEHLQNVNNSDDKLEFSENIQLLEWQIDKKENCKSVIEQLAVLCKKEWEGSKEANDTITEFKRILKVDDFAFEWTVMNVLASMKMWPQLINFFTKPNWLTKKHSLKSVIRAELFVYGLSCHDPPKDVLEQYLPYISDSESSLCLAQKLNCHKFVVNYYLSQKDRLALLAYKIKFSPQHPEYFMIENILQIPDKKWKN